MSAIAALYNVPFTPEEWAIWSFAHAAHHRDINRVIYEQTGDLLPEFGLDPFDPADARVWLQNHQVMHLNQDAILGISPSALYDVSFEDRGETQGWIFLHSNEHRLAANILGIG